MTPPNTKTYCINTIGSNKIYSIEQYPEDEVRPDVTCLSQNFEDVYCIFPQILTGRMSYKVSYNITDQDEDEIRSYEYNSTDVLENGDMSFTHYQKDPTHLQFSLKFITMQFSHYTVLFDSTDNNVTTSQMLEFDLDEIGKIYS